MFIASDVNSNKCNLIGLKRKKKKNIALTKSKLKSWDGKKVLNVQGRQSFKRRQFFIIFKIKVIAPSIWPPLFIWPHLLLLSFSLCAVTPASFLSLEHSEPTHIFTAGCMLRPVPTALLSPSVPPGHSLAHSHLSSNDPFSVLPSYVLYIKIALALAFVLHYSIFHSAHIRSSHIIYFSCLFPDFLH